MHGATLPDGMEAAFNEHTQPRYSFAEDARRADAEAVAQAEEQATTVSSATTAERSANELRPITFDTVVGQDKVKKILARMVEASKRMDRVLDHVLLVGPSGTGKTTLANVIAHELGKRVFQVEAPVGIETLCELRTTMEDGDILFIDEIHMQAAQDRRGASASMSPETFYNVLEDRTLVFNNQVLPFPHITCVGATTDEGLLPQPFLNRFPLRPRLEKYTEDDMTEIAVTNAVSLGLGITEHVARRFAKASRGVPREINNFVKNAASLAWSIDDELASEVIFDLNGLTDDGLTRDMQATLCFLYTRCKRVRAADGETTYQASIATLATAIGKSRDVKSLHLYVEPYLLELGLMQVSGGGRSLTDAGILRALELLRG